jgi:hypothetical protein
MVQDPERASWLSGQPGGVDVHLGFEGGGQHGLGAHEHGLIEGRAHLRAATVDSHTRFGEAPVSVVDAHQPVIPGSVRSTHKGHCIPGSAAPLEPEAQG